MASLVNNLGGDSGFGENYLYRNDDGYTSAIDITSVFENGLNLFGTVYDSIYVNTNGNITFNGGLSSYTPSEINSSSNQAIIAPFWADVDTRSGTLTANDGTVVTDIDYGITAYRNYLSDDTNYFSNFDVTNALSQVIDLNSFSYSLYSFDYFLSSAAYISNFTYDELSNANLEDYYNFLVAKNDQLTALNNSAVYDPSGNSTGSNLVWYDVDPTTDTVTITWDDVGYFSYAKNKTNAFQLQLIDTNDGSFDMKFIYEDINWTTGNASDGVNGLGGSVARAGYSAGDGQSYYELPFSGDQNSMLNLDSYVLGGQSEPGVWTLTLNDGKFEGIGLEYSDDSLDGSTNSDVLDGRSGNDTLHGYSGDDTITGGLGDDLLYGEDGNDIFFSGYGTDYIYGGLGNDIVSYLNYTYDMLQYDFFDDYINIYYGDIFNDTIYDVESISLSDVQMSFDTLLELPQVQEEVVRLYNAILGRNPDDDGFNYWLDSILSTGSNNSVQTISNAFADSSEYSVRFGAQSDEAFINQLYNNILDRNADQAGYDYWMNEIAITGDRGGMIVSFSNSDEYIAAQQAVVEDYLNNVVLDLNLI